MISNLRARLSELSAKPAETPAREESCWVREERFQLADFPGLLTARDVHRLGLDFPGFDARRALFLDTETTGLRGAGTVAFLLGLGWIEGEEFVLRQLLMRDYGEEPPLLEAFADLLPGFTAIVSFNGKSFDVPLLRDRFLMARLRHRWRELPHLDLLHAARRTWKLRLGSCTLGVVERAALGVEREGDLPGSEVPERYFQFLKCGEMALLEDVLRHNAQDVRTLARLLARLAQIYAEPERQESLLDVFSVGRALERAGEGEAARRCFRVASVAALSEQARLCMARSYAREKDWSGAAAAYREIEGESLDACVRLAIVLEWRLGAPGEALAVTERAILRFSGGRADVEALDALEKRRTRLKRKLEGKTCR